MSYNLGIDVGNTYVAVALARATAVEMFHFSDHAVVTPATVYLRDDGTLAAGEAASPAGSNLDRLGGAFMGRLGDPTPLVVGGEPYIVTDLLGILLHDVVQQVTGAQGEPPDHIVLTYPASWGAFRRALFEEAVRRAGLDKASTVTEPEAAATYYNASQRWNDDDTVAVYDLGGDTFNATVLLKQSGGSYILGEPERIEHLGGSEFDETILSNVNDTVDGALSELDTTRPQNIVALAGVRQECTRAKEALSADAETIFPVLLPGRRFDVRLARSDFEDMVHGPIELTINALSRTLHSAEVEPSDLSAVLLLGGSSRIPLVAQMVSAKLGCSVVLDPHPQHVVALGAAALAAQAARSDRSQHGERQNDKQKRLAVNGATTSTLTAKSVVDAAQQRDTQQHNVAQRSAGVIPPPRTPPREATAAAAPTAIGSSKVDPDVTTVQAPALIVKPRPVQPQRPTTTQDTRPAAGKRGRALRRASANHVAPPRVLIGGGMAVTLTVSILLALFGGRSPTQTPAPSALARPSNSETTAMADLGPEVAIPAVAATIPLGPERHLRQCLARWQARLRRQRRRPDRHRGEHRGRPRHRDHPDRRGPTPIPRFRTGWPHAVCQHLQRSANNPLDRRARPRLKLRGRHDPANRTPLPPGGHPGRQTALCPQPRRRRGVRDRHRHQRRHRTDQGRTQPTLGRLLPRRQPRLHRQSRIQPNLGDRHHHPESSEHHPGRNEPA